MSVIDIYIHRPIVIYEGLGVQHRHTSVMMNSGSRPSPCLSLAVYLNANSKRKKSKAIKEKNITRRAGNLTILKWASATILLLAYMSAFRTHSLLRMETIKLDQDKKLQNTKLLN